MVSTDGLSADDVAELHRVITQALLLLRSDGQPVPAEGWTVVAAAELHRRLVAAGRPVQALVLRYAAAHEGHCDRETVYELGSYPSTRALKGFTRPLMRVMQDMIHDSLLSADAPLPLQTQYDPAGSTFQKAQGFAIPQELRQVFAEALADA